MVRPVPSNPNSTDDLDSNHLEAREAHNNSIYQAGDDTRNIVDDRRNSAEDALRHRFGSLLSLRSSSSRTPYEESSEEGAALYRHFLAEEFRRRNLPEPAEYLLRDVPYNNLPENSSGDLVRAANQLRILSEEFARTPMRQWVEEQAARVPLDGLDFEAFSDLLYGLFQEGGVTWERVVVLFCFCADLTVRAFREKLPQQFYNIVDWSFKFISGEKMLRWIADHGGWINVLQKSIDNAYKLARIGFFVMGILAFAAYIWKSQ